MDQPQDEPALKKPKTDVLPNIYERYNETLEALNQRLEEHDQNRRAEQERLLSICSELKRQIDHMEEEINGKLERNFTEEDTRLQTALNELRMVSPGENSEDETKKAIQKARAELVLKKSYRLCHASKLWDDRALVSSTNDIININDSDDDMHDDMDEDDMDEDMYYDDTINSLGDSGNEDQESSDDDDDDENDGSLHKPDQIVKLSPSNSYGLSVINEISSSFLDLERPTKAEVTGVYEGRIFIKFDRNTELERVFEKSGVEGPISYTIFINRENDEWDGYNLRSEGGDSFSFSPDVFVARATYTVKIKTNLANRTLMTSKPQEILIPKFSECYGWNKFGVSVNDFANGHNVSNNWVLIGSAAFPLRRIFSWSVVISKTKDNNGMGIKIGVGKFISTKECIGRQNCIRSHDHKKRGWYIDCYDSSLYSGPPHNYKGKEYGPRKQDGGYVHAGDSIGVVMDTTRGDLSFMMDRVNLGVAYEGIPLDKPLVPCVFLYCGNDSVELDLSEPKENLTRTARVPSNFRAESGITWDSMVLSWDLVPGALFYQVEMNGRKLPNVMKENAFIKTGLLSETEYVFRVRCVYGNSVGCWSLYANGKTQRKELRTIGWAECLCGNNYTLNKSNVRTVTANTNESCTIKSNMPLPRNGVISWSINMFPSNPHAKNSFFVGVARHNSDGYGNKDKMIGWYLCCSRLELYSKNYITKETCHYGPPKEEGQFIRSVGVTMDTSNGKLSFIINGVNYGVAFDKIPCDTDIFPSIILSNKGDSAELNLSVLKENVNGTLPVPMRFYITTNSWRSVGISWDPIDGTTRYQLEVDGSLQRPVSTNTFVKKDASPDTEYTFRVRSVRGDGVSMWSSPLKWRTQKKIFDNIAWKDCPLHIEKEKAYIVNETNPRIVENAGPKKHFSTIIGEICIPEGKVSFWEIKILKSQYGTSSSIYVGVAPQDINQDSGVNQKECGWYFHCYDSRLYSGPPHNCRGVEYGSGKGVGKRLKPGESVCVVMNMLKGELSFVVKGVNLGVAYSGIPLDKPLVPCVILSWGGDSVEIIK